MARAQSDLLRDLRAAAEATRLRLLAVLAMGEFSVTDLTRILGQSQPRVSRHLKLLGEAGLLERFREQHWIYYRVPSVGEGAEFVAALLCMMDAEDQQLRIDRDRAMEILGSRDPGSTGRPGSGSSGSETDERELAGLLVTAIAPGVESLLYVGNTLAGPLSVLGPHARRVVGLSQSLAEVRKARASLHGRGLSHCVLHQGDLRALPQGKPGFAAIVLDRVLAGRDRPRAALQETASMLGPAGQLLLVEYYDALADSDPGSNAIEVMRGWLESSGLVCTRVKPVDLGDAHLLVGIGSDGELDAAQAAA